MTAGESAVSTPAGLAESEAYLRKVLARAAHEETGGWVADMLAAEFRAGRLTPEQFVDVGLLFIVGATETTTALTGMAIHRLAIEPALQERLRADPSLIEPFVEEALRYEAPVQRRPRVVTQPVEIGGVRVPEGDCVVLLIGAANRDPARFSHPGTFDIDRPDNRHLSFGGGPHVCPGAQLGRMEVQAVIASILAKLPPFRMADPLQPLEQPASLTMRGPRKLHIAFDTHGR